MAKIAFRLRNKNKIKLKYMKDFFKSVFGAKISPIIVALLITFSAGVVGVGVFSLNQVSYGSNLNFPSVLYNKHGKVLGDLVDNTIPPPPPAPSSSGSQCQVLTGATNLRYFGFYDTSASNLVPSSTVEQVQGFTNLSMISGGLNFILTELAKVKSANEQAIISFLGIPEDPVGWQSVAAALQPYYDSGNIVGFYVSDDAWNVTLAQMQMIKSTFPNAKLVAIFESPTEALQNTQNLEELDWVGLETYYYTDSADTTGWYNQLLPDMNANAKFILVPGAFTVPAGPLNYYEGKSDNEAYYIEPILQMATNNPKVVGIMPFIWQDQGGETGTVDVPDYQSRLEGLGSCFHDFTPSTNGPSIFLNGNLTPFSENTNNGQITPSSQSFTISNDGNATSTLNWKATTNQSWCLLDGSTSITGISTPNNPASVKVSIDAQETSAPGTCTILVQDNGSVPPSSNSSESLQVNYSLNNPLLSNAAYVSQSVPSTMTAGQTVSVSLTFTNTGSTTWTSATNFKLGSQNPQDNNTWGTGRVLLNTSDSIAPGQTKTFTFNITAPNVPGTYNFQWQMLEEWVDWFGVKSPNVPIIVTAGSSQSVSAVSITNSGTPPSVALGGMLDLQFTGINLSNTSFDVAFTGPSGGTTTIASAGSGSTTTAQYPITDSVIPSTDYTISQIRIHTSNNNSTWITVNVPFTVTSSSVISAISVSPSSGSGFGPQNYSMNFTDTAGASNIQQAYIMFNDFSASGPTWTNSCTVYYSVINNMLQLINDAGNGWINIGAPGSASTQSNTFCKVTAAGSSVSASGTSYSLSNLSITFQPTWSGTKNIYLWADNGTQNTGWVNEGSWTVPPQSSGFGGSAEYSSEFSSVPAILTPGEQTQATLTFINNGTTTWSSYYNYSLGTQNPSDNDIWGTSVVNLDSSDYIAPGQSKTFTIPIKAPFQPGSYNFQWQMVQNGVNWFGAKSTNFNITVSSSSNPPAIPNLDSRLGVTHVGGSYPNEGINFLYNGALDALNLGFKNIELYLNPTGECLSNSDFGHGAYQTYSWCGPQSGVESYSDLAKTPQYQKALALPFKTFFLTTEGDYVPGTIPGDGSVSDGVLFTQSEINATYQDYYNLTSYLLQTYQGTGKTFIIQSSNEMDWQMLPPNSSASAIPSTTTIANAITYWNTIQQAITDARNAIGTKGDSVYQGCEVNLVDKAMNGGITATNNVIPETDCDYYSYSSWDTVQSSDTSLFLKALTYLASKAHGQPVYISESGRPENQLPSATDLANYNQHISEALKFGVPYFLFWQMYDNNCSQYLPQDSQCPGNWIRTPDGTLSNDYQTLAEYLSTTTQSTASIDLSSSYYNFTSTVGSNPSNQMLTISNSSTATLNWSAANTGSWLSLSPTSGTVASGGQGAILTLSVNTAGLSAGTYDATTTITSNDPSRSSVSIPVTLTIINNNTQSNAIFVSQSVPPGTMAPGQSIQVTFTLTNTGNTTWTEANNFKLGSQDPQDNSTWGTGRILLMPTDSIAPGQNKTFSFYITAPTTAGTYGFQWQMLQENVTWFGVKSTPYLITVSGPTSKVPVLSLAPSSFYYTTPIGSNPASQSLKINNTGTATLNWSAANTGSWLSLSPTSGTVASGGQGAILTLSVNTAGLSAGTYDATTTITSNDPNHASVNIPVSLTIAANSVPVISAVSLSPNSGSGLTQTFKSSFIDTAGANNISFTQMSFQTGTGWPVYSNSCVISYYPSDQIIKLMSDSGSWLTVGTLGSNSSLANSQCSVSAANASVTASGDTFTFSIPISFNSLWTGTKNIWIEADNGVQSSNWIEEGSWTVGSTMSISPDSLSFTVNQGNNPSSQTLDVGNSGINSMGWSISTTDSSWLSASPTTGTTSAGSDNPAITVSINSSNLSPGNYSGYIYITFKDSANTTMSVPVALTVNKSSNSASPSLSLSQSSFSFSALSGSDPTSQILTISNTGTANLSWSVTNTGSWLAVNRNLSGQATSGTEIPNGSSVPPLTLAVNDSGLAVGSYSATITLTTNDPNHSLVSIPVTLSLTAPTINLSAPTLLSPANGTITTAAGLTSINWNSVTDSVGGITYIYQSSNSSAILFNGAFATPKFTSGFLTATSEPTPGTPPGVYYWHVQATDSQGNVSPWSSSWMVTVTSSITPVISATSLNPDSGSGLSQIFSGTFTDTAGASDIQHAYISLISNNQPAPGNPGSSNNICSVLYTKTTNSVALINDAGTGYLTPFTINQPGAESNSQCLLGTLLSSVSSSGNTLTYNIDIALNSPSWAGTKNVYLYADNGTTSQNQNSGWVKEGTWTFPTP
jgi:uncharacterized membrane protein